MYDSRMTDGRRKVVEALRITPRPLSTISALFMVSKPIARLVLHTWIGS